MLFRLARRKRLELKSEAAEQCVQSVLNQRERYGHGDGEFMCKECGLPFLTEKAVEGHLTARNSDCMRVQASLEEVQAALAILEEDEVD
jgi:hypothetical protein